MTFDQDGDLALDMLKDTGAHSMHSQDFAPQFDHSLFGPLAESSYMSHVAPGPFRRVSSTDELYPNFGHEKPWTSHSSFATSPFIMLLNAASKPADYPLEIPHDPTGQFPFPEQPFQNAMGAIQSMPTCSDATTISPLQTYFDLNRITPLSRAESELPSTTSGTSSNSRSSRHSSLSTSRSRKPSSVSFKSEPGTTSSVQQIPEQQTPARRQRRRKSLPAEPGSARAIYLEKNRLAASKCRNKQKLEMEELVENARELERRNKLLKHEIGLLRGEMTDLMGTVSAHNQCSDKRLHDYVQREANRLAGTGSAPVIKQEDGDEEMNYGERKSSMSLLRPEHRRLNEACSSWERF